MVDIRVPWIVCDTVKDGEPNVRLPFIVASSVQGGTLQQVRLPFIVGSAVQGGTLQQVRCPLIVPEIIFAVPPGGFVLTEVFPELRGLSWSVNRMPAFSTLKARHQSGYEVRAALYQYPLWTFKLQFDYLPNREDGITDTDLQTLLGFFLARQGCWEPFLYRDPENYIVQDQALGTGNGAQTQFPLLRRVGAFFELVGQLNTRAAFTFTSAGVNITDNTVSAPDHGFTSGYGPVQLVAGGALPTGLLASTNYWLYAATSDTLGFATSRADAIAGTVVDLTAVGSGTTQANNDVAIYADGVLVSPADYTFLGPNQIVFDAAPAADVVITADFQYYFVVRFEEDEQDYEEFMDRLYSLQECGLTTVLNP